MTTDEKKMFMFFLITVLFALIGYQAYENSLNNPIVNNTNLAPTVDGYIGTGERIQGVNYTAKTTLLAMVFIHTMPGTIDIDCYINGVKVQDDDTMVSGATPGNRSKNLIIPKGSTYKFEITGSATHHYEWREYILSK